MAFQNFIVLGIIPGTNIQINFQLWFEVVLVIVALWQVRRLLRSKLLAALLLKLAFSNKISSNVVNLPEQQKLAL